jgi:hypothetical protein
VTRRALRPRRRRDADGGFGAAGWLFAELALVLVIIAVASEAPPLAAVAPPPPVSTPTEGLALKTDKFTMFVPADGQRVVETFTERLVAKVGPNARVGLVLLFGVSRSPDQPLQGSLVAQRLKELIEPAGIPQLRAAVDIRAYLGGREDGQPGDVTVELFLLTGPS